VRLRLAALGGLLALLACGRSTSEPPTMGAAASQVSWTVPAWYVDPANATGCASDSNTCTAPACGAAGVGPCATLNGGPIARWGTRSPILPQATTITIESNDVSSDALQVMATGPLTIQGTLQPVGSSLVLTSFTPKNKVTGTPNRVTVSGQTWTPGTVLRDTSAGLTMMVDADLTGGVAQVTEPFVAPVGIALVRGTPIAGDTLQVYQPTVLYLQSARSNGGAVSFPIQLVDLALETPSNFAGYIGTLAGVLECAVTNNSNIQIVPDNGSESSPFFISDWFNSYFGAGSFTGTATFWGGALNGAGNAFLNMTWLDFDVLVNLRSHQNGLLQVGTAYFGQWPENSVGFQTLAQIVVIPSSGGVGTVWGPAAITLTSGQQLIVRSTTATSALLTTGTALIDGISTAYPWVAASHAYGAAVAITPANIDSNSGLSDPASGSAIHF
jgi:hypothetical protein